MSRTAVDIVLEMVERKSISIIDAKIILGELSQKETTQRRPIPGESSSTSDYTFNLHQTRYPEYLQTTFNSPKDQNKVKQLVTEKK